MRNVNPQHYYSKGKEAEISSEILDNAVTAIRKIQSVDSRLFPLLTLNHLSRECGISYGYLRKVISRKIGCYRHFDLKKRVPGRTNVRMISVPTDELLTCQKWIVANILKFGAIHDSSYAYHPGSSAVNAARCHVNARWLIKVDVQDFFHNISEYQVFDVFRSLGYSHLLSFEMARICTMACERSGKKKYSQEAVPGSVINYYKTSSVGILPQGAPTSPMLSNLVMRNTDTSLSTLARNHGMRFTRYADDIVFSTSRSSSYQEINQVKRQIVEILNHAGFKANLRKTVTRGPGSRKIVLGMVVHAKHPKLTKEFKDTIRLHLYYLRHPDFGPSAHAEARNTSISKIYHHVLGLIYWAIAVEPSYGNKTLDAFNEIAWPPISRSKYFTNTN